LCPIQRQSIERGSVFSTTSSRRKEVNKTTVKMSKEITYSEVQKHSGKKDLWLVIHDKVYNTTSFVDEHP
jgi:cytochrome b involved in lipid metabolism